MSLRLVRVCSAASAQLKPAHMLIVREVKGINFQIFGFPVPVLDGSGNNLIINISLIFPASFPHPWPWLAGSVCGNVTYLPNCRVYCAS